jgi:hypothetical protein
MRSYPKDWGWAQGCRLCPSCTVELDEWLKPRRYSTKEIGLRKQTIREALDAHLIGTFDGVEAFDQEVVDEMLRRFPAISVPRLVALDVEAGAKELESCHSKPMNRGITRGIVSAILKACGIIVPDEVVEVPVGGWLDLEHIQSDVETHDTHWSFNHGHTITITRKSTLQPQVNEVPD